MTRLVLLASLIAACSKSAPEAETQSVQPPPSVEGGANLDRRERETEVEAEVPTEEVPALPGDAPPDDGRAEDETASRDQRPDSLSGMLAEPQRLDDSPIPPQDLEPVGERATMRRRRPVGNSLDDSQGALQLDE